MSSLTDHKDFVEFFEENKGIKLHEVEQKSKNIYWVHTHNDEFKVTVRRNPAGDILEAVISYDR